MNKHQNKNRIADHPFYQKIFRKLLGKHHTKHHRVCVGLVVMAIGVCIAKCANFFGAWYMEYTVDGAGYFIHAVGATPLLELLND